MPYHSYDELVNLFLSLERSRPDVVSHEEVGRSVKGRPIYLFKFGPDWMDKVYYIGSIHGNEHPGAELLYMYARWLVEEREPIASDILNRACTLILPVANPDGFDSYTRVNSNCVDLNRNFPKGWGGTGSSPGSCCDICRGYSPADQPETRAVISVMDRYRPRWFLDIHSGTEALGYAWSCWSTPPPDNDKYVEVCNKYVDLANRRGVKPYPWNQVPLSEKPMDRAVPIEIPGTSYIIYACCGTSIDTAYDKGIMAMTLEASSSYNPSYDYLESYYFPRFLPLAITMSMEVLGAGFQDYWIILALALIPIAIIGGVVVSQEVAKE